MPPPPVSSCTPPVGTWAPLCQTGSLSGWARSTTTPSAPSAALSDAAATGAAASARQRSLGHSERSQHEGQGRGAMTQPALGRAAQGTSLREFGGGRGGGRCRGTSARNGRPVHCPGPGPGPYSIQAPTEAGPAPCPGSRNCEETRIVSAALRSLYLSLCLLLSLSIFRESSRGAYPALPGVPTLGRHCLPRPTLGGASPALPRSLPGTHDQPTGWSALWWRRRGLDAAQVLHRAVAPLWSATARDTLRFPQYSCTVLRHLACAAPAIATCPRSRRRLQRSTAHGG